MNNNPDLDNEQLRDSQFEEGVLNVDEQQALANILRKRLRASFWKKKRSTYHICGAIRKKV